MQSKEWQQKFADQVGKGIDNAREGRSDQWIADRTKELGHPLSRTAISEYRRGVRKSMPVTDLMIIAQALRVPPVTLLFPNLPNGEVVLVPSTDRPTALDSLFWFTGETGWLPSSYKIFREFDSEGNVQDPIPRTMYSSLGGSGSVEAFNSTQSRILNVSRDLAEAWNELRATFRALADPNDPQAALPAEVKNSRYNFALSRIDEISERLTALGGDMTNWDEESSKDNPHGNS